jgi:hypothetical protein
LPLPLDRIPHSRAHRGHHPPSGVAEAINWTLALDLLGLADLDEDAVASTLGSVLKYREDLDAAHERGLAWVAGSA